MAVHMGGVYNAFRPVYIVSKVLGVMPLKYVRRGDVHHQSGNVLRFSKTHGIVTLFWFLLVLFQTAYIPYYLFTTGSTGMKGYENNSTSNGSLNQNLPQPHEDIEDSWQSRVILVMNPIITSVLGVQCRVTALFKLPKTLPRILSKLHKTDLLLATSPKLHRTYFCYLLRMFVLYSFVASLSLSYYLQAFISSRNTAVALGMVCLQISNIVSFCTELQFSALCYLVFVRFKQINTELKKWRKTHEKPIGNENKTPMTIHLNEFSVYRNLKEEKNDFIQRSNFKPRTINTLTSERIFTNVREVQEKQKYPTKLVKYFNNQVKKLAPFYSQKVQQFPTDQEISQSRYKSLADLLSTLRRSHMLLHEAIYDINTLYRGQLLVSMSGCFGNGLLNIYFTIFGFRSPNPVGNAIQNLYASKLHQALGSFALCSYFVGRFVIMTAMASRTVDKAERCIVHVSALNDRDVPAEAKEEFQIFFNQAQSEKPLFSACGYFTMEMNLITSALAAWCTYLVIMAQFHDAK